MEKPTYKRYTHLSFHKVAFYFEYDNFEAVSQKAN